MIDRPMPNEYNPYYDTYIRLVQEGGLVAGLEAQLDETVRLLSAVPEERWSFRYAPDKWTLKDVVGHISDNERIMAYRLLCIAYGEQAPLPGYDQDAYMENDPFRDCTLPELLDDYAAVRRATLALLKRLPRTYYARVGNANGSVMSARALAYIIAGHELHHLQIIRERYL